jgi:hypothetical protein
MRLRRWGDGEMSEQGRKQFFTHHSSLSKHCSLLLSY